MSGIRARGGITVDMAWREGKVTSLTLIAKQHCEVTLQVNGTRKMVKLNKGKNRLNVQ